MTWVHPKLSDNMVRTPYEHMAVGPLPLDRRDSTEDDMRSNINDMDERQFHLPLPTNFKLIDVPDTSQRRIKVGST